jgi:predicted nucleic acid-binding Zn ribbon protein
MSESLKDLLVRYAKRKKISKALVATKALSVWSEVIHEVIPALSPDDCRAIAFKAETLTVEVKGSSLASELRFREQELVSQTNDRFEEPVIQRIRWRIV